MANTIQLKRSSVAAKVPTTSDLALGELGINTHDGKVYIKKNDGADAVVEVGSTVTMQVRNDTGSTITKGTPIYVSGTHASGKPNVDLADSDGAGTHPAQGIVMKDIADGAEGTAVISGLVENLNTSSYSAGDPLYLSTTAGELTGTKPTGDIVKVQKMAVVTRAHATAGSIIVIGAGRANEVTNEIIALTGVAVDSVDLGTFTGTTVADNRTIKDAIQDLETGIESNSANVGTGINAGFQYEYDNGTSSNPSSGEVRANNSDWSLATVIYVHKEDDDSRDLSNIYNIFLKKGVRIYMQQNKQSTKAFFATLSADATLNGNVYSLPVTGVTTLTGGTAQDGKDLTFAIVSPKHELSYDAGTRVLSGPGDVSATLTEVVASGNSGLMTGSDKDKLDNIESGAEVNPTAAETRTTLGIGEYADDTAAGSGGLAAGDLFFNTTTSTYRLKA